MIKLSQFCPEDFFKVTRVLICAFRESIRSFSSKKQPTVCLLEHVITKCPSRIRSSSPDGAGTCSSYFDMLYHYWDESSPASQKSPEWSQVLHLSWWAFTSSPLKHAYKSLSSKLLMSWCQITGWVITTSASWEERRHPQKSSTFLSTHKRALAQWWDVILSKMVK